MKGNFHQAQVKVRLDGLRLSLRRSAGESSVSPPEGFEEGMADCAAFTTTPPEVFAINFCIKIIC